MKIKPTLNLYKDFYEELNPELLDKINLINKVIDSGLLDNSLVQNFNDKGFRTDFGLNILAFKLREEYISKFGFSLMNQLLIDELAFHFENKEVIELGAGTGWLSHLLQNKNIDIQPIDLYHIDKNDYNFYQYHTNVLNISAQDYLAQNKNYDCILMSWPNYGTDFAAQSLDLIPKGKQLIYIGESCGGCTANDRFFDLLDARCLLNEEKTSQLQKFTTRWSGLHDDIYIYDVVN